MDSILRKPRYARVILPALVALVLLVLASSCQQTFSNNFADTAEAGTCGEGGLPPPPKACTDTIAALASAKVRCGSAISYDASFDDLLDAAADGSCANVTSIRDETELCFECLPTLETLPCTDVASDKLPLSCQQQLQRPQ